MLNTLRLVSVCLIGSIFFLGTVAATAQEYPSKPIRLIVPTTPGATADTVSRIVAPEISKYLGQPVVIENRPGGDMVIGFEYVARLPPADGYTLVSTTVSNLAILPLIVKDLRFDPLKDLPPIVGFGEGRFILGSSSQHPWKTLNEFVSYAKANPGKLNYGSSSPNLHLLADALLHDLGLNLVHIPYQGAAPYFVALSGTEIHIGFTSEAQAIVFGEKFRVLALTGAKGNTRFGDAPNLSDIWVPNVPGLSFSLNARTGTPKNAIDRIYSAVSRTMQQPEVKTRFESNLIKVLDETPEVASKTLAEQAKFFSDLARKIARKPQ